MFIIYDLIFLIFSIVWLPVYLFKRKFHPGFSSRLGNLPKDLKLNRPIWIHAVSVGEVMAVRILVEQLRSIYPTKQFVISTVTPTGNKIAKSLAKNDFVTYLPLDFSFIVKKVIDRINPCIFIIAETEIWPNLISYLYKKDIPVITVNGRISDSSLRGYLAIKFFIKNVLRKVTLLCVQSQRDADRLCSLGVKTDKIAVTGNMKFDTTPACRQAGLPAGQAGITTDLKNKLGLRKEDRIFIAASTHPGEEEIILKAYQSLLADFGDLNLIIAPRHPERGKEVSKVVSEAHFCSSLFSQPPKAFPCVTKTVFILDVIGQLLDFYHIADIVFVGGSLIKKGGHNILEPAALAKPIIFGPHMFNFSDIADLFLSHRAAILVTNEEEIASTTKQILSDSTKALALGKRARGLVQQNQGATKRNLEYIRKFVV